MNNGILKRLRYYKGQKLIAKDFEDQQTYHIEKLNQLVKRFPFGIIGGLHVIKQTEVDEDNPETGFLIQEGLAVNENGDYISVGEEGIFIPISEVEVIPEDQRYLSLKYHQEIICAEHSFCESEAKYNRIVESANHVWDPKPNMDSRITVAFIKGEGNKINDYDIKEDKDDDGRTIRIEAAIVDTENITDEAITEKKIARDAVTRTKIADDAVTESKITDDAVTKEKIASGEVVKSLNDLKDDIALEQGSNVTITKSNNKLSIAAEADGHSLDAADGSQTDVVFVNNAGNVGINTTNPEKTLHIKGAMDPTLKIQSDGNSEVSGRVSLRQENNTGADIYYDGRSGVEGLAIETFFGGSTNGVKIFIQNNGNIGIRNADPQEELDVSGTTQMTGFKMTTNPDNGKVLISDSQGQGTWQQVGPDGIEINAVTENKIKNNAVTDGKIAANAVIEGKIAANSVTSNKIADNVITSDKLSYEIKDSGEITIDGNRTGFFRFPDTFINSDFNRPLIGYVIPNERNDPLSWNMLIYRISSARLYLYFQVTNHGSSPAPFTIRLLTFN